MTNEGTDNQGAITIIGVGYVGLVTGATFAKHGHHVRCYDIDTDKLEQVETGVVPFFEPGLSELVKEVVERGTLTTTSDLAAAIQGSALSFICVGTPTGTDGTADLGAVRAVAAQIGDALSGHNGYHVIVTKSTVPPGTGLDVVCPTVEEHAGTTRGDGFGYCSNPEFLREGAAVDDAFNPDRIVIGQLDEKCGAQLAALYRNATCPVLTVDISTAEMIKYTANSFLATKISFSNEIANICERVGVDVKAVMNGVGLDHRIEPAFMNAGLGFGGSCFPKDVLALLALGKQHRVRVPMLKAVLRVNSDQPLRAVDLLMSRLGSLRRRRITVLGLSFKPNTDDVRKTRALPLIEALLSRGADVFVYCPQGMGNFQAAIEERLPPHDSTRIVYNTSAEKALKNAEGCVIQSEWDEFRDLAPETFKREMRRPLIVDGRRIYDPEVLLAAGIEYIGIGWGGNYKS